jgi:hypothetical protein
MNSIYFIKWFVGKTAGNNEHQIERRTPKKTKDEYLAAFPWRGSAMELNAVCSTHTVVGKTAKPNHKY